WWRSPEVPARRQGPAGLTRPVGRCPSRGASGTLPKKQRDRRRASKNPLNSFASLRTQRFHPSPLQEAWTIACERASRSVAARPFSFMPASRRTHLRRAFNSLTTLYETDSSAQLSRRDFRVTLGGR